MLSIPTSLKCDYTAPEHFSGSNRVWAMQIRGIETLQIKTKNNNSTELEPHFKKVGFFFVLLVLAVDLSRKVCDDRYNETTERDTLIMKTITIYREDMNNSLHGNLFNSLLEDLGVATHTLVAGRMIDNEIEEITLNIQESQIVTS